MNIKPIAIIYNFIKRFESNVISYEYQTRNKCSSFKCMFESNVISYEYQTYILLELLLLWFESNVISYEYQTPKTKRIPLSNV